MKIKTNREKSGKLAEKEVKSVSNPQLGPGSIWVTGLSASGKTTICTALFQQLTQKGYGNIELIDGEDLRKTFERDYGYSHGYSVEERLALTRLTVPYIERMVRAGKLVILSGICHKKEERRLAKSQIKPLMEVYLKCPVEVCAVRDVKGHYKRAFAGEYDMFVGVTHSFEESDDVDLVLETDKLSIAASTKTLLSKSIIFFGD